MREAMIICPTCTNDGADMSLIQRKAVAMMVDAFGGCTVTEAYGHWRNDAGEIMSEPVWQLVSAAVNGASARSTLQDIARYVCDAGRQYCVYARMPDGEAIFVQPSQPIAAEAVA